MSTAKNGCLRKNEKERGKSLNDEESRNSLDGEKKFFGRVGGTF